MPKCKYCGEFSELIVGNLTEDCSPGENQINICRKEFCFDKAIKNAKELFDNVVIIEIATSCAVAMIKENNGWTVTNCTIEKIKGFH